MAKPKFMWWKFIAVWIGFLLLHFSYKTFPGLFFKIVAEDHEATFFHMKMLFVSYSLVSLVELWLRRKAIASKSAFLYSRALLAVAFPWLTITLWFTAEALGIQLPVTPWELIYANVLTALGIYLVLRLEEVLDGVQFRPSLKALVVALYLAAVLSYVSFSLNVPVHFFTTPPEF